MCALIALLKILVLVRLVTGEAAVLKEPVSINITYGEIANFSCSVRGDHRGGQLFWRIGDYYNDPRASLDREGYRTDYTAARHIRSSTLYINGSLYANNNLEIQCGIFNIFSSIAILNINGLIFDLNVSVTLRSEMFIHITWLKPALYIDSHSYMIVVSNPALRKEKNISVDGSVSEHRYSPDNKEDFCTMLKFCVLTVRSSTVGEISGCVTTSFKRGVITDGPDLSIITQGSVRLSCQITCSENSWVTWVVNGKPIQLFPQVGSSVSNDYNVKCSPNGVNNDTILSRSYLEHLEVATYFEIAKVPLGVQCVSVHHCSRDTGSCHDSVCYSNVTLLVQNSKYYTQGLDKTFVATVYSNGQGETSSSSCSDAMSAIIGVCSALASLLILTCGTVMIFLCFYAKKKVKDQRTVLASMQPRLVQEEHIYELCGGPTNKGESLYDKPRTPSPQPTMQNCEAYLTVPPRSQ